MKVCRVVLVLSAILAAMDAVDKAWAVLVG
jgi:hypothetical protein